MFLFCFFLLILMRKELVCGNSFYPKSILFQDFSTNLLLKTFLLFTNYYDLLVDARQLQGLLDCSGRSEVLFLVNQDKWFQSKLIFPEKKVLQRFVCCRIVLRELSPLKASFGEIRIYIETLACEGYLTPRIRCKSCSLNDISFTIETYIKFIDYSHHHTKKFLYIWI